MASIHEFWADRMADEIIDRVEEDPQLARVVEQHGFFVYDEKTPSGPIHIGSGRGWVIHDVLAKALRAKGRPARFVLSSDDYDPLDKPVKGHPEFDKYLGMPFISIPSPVQGYESYAAYYFAQSTERFAEWGIEADLESTGEEYRKGTFNAAIKTALDRHRDVAAVFERIYEKPYEKLPFNPICERCGRIGTTIATAWDPDREIVTYECRPDLVTWAVGCGHTGTMRPYDGKGKLPWKVEWPAKWVSKGVLVELAGKDHFTKNGSRTVGIALSSEVFAYPPPWPSTPHDEGKGYEFFNLGGKKMSTSKGVGVNFAEITDHIPAQILRFLMVMYKPTSVIDFDPSRKNDLLLLYDRYDTAERVYFGVEESDRKEELSRTYAYSHIGTVPATMPPQITLRHAAVVVQIAGDDAAAIALLQKTGHVPSELSEEHARHVALRLQAARQWLAEFAPESERFVVQDSVSDEVSDALSAEQRAALGTLAAALDEEHDEESLFQEFYRICEACGVKNTDFFTAAYRALLNKDRGPKLATLILSIGTDRARSLLKAASLKTRPVRGAT